MGHCVYIGSAEKGSQQLTSSVQADFVTAMLHKFRAAYRRRKEQEEQAELDKELAEMKARGENPGYGFGWGNDSQPDPAYFPVEAVKATHAEVPTELPAFLAWYAQHHEGRQPSERDYVEFDFIAARTFVQQAAEQDECIYSY